MDIEGTSGRPDSLVAFELGLKRLVAVPKKALDRKVKAFKRRKKKPRSR